MIKEIEITLPPEEINKTTCIDKAVSREIRVPLEKINAVEVLKRSIDARKHNVKFRLKVKVYTNESYLKDEVVKKNYQNVKNSDPVIIVGAGPAGLFAAMRLLELGLKPIIIERGKEIHDRKADIALINRSHVVNPDSNYCFGEGGAGTYSDGKLYTRSTKRGDVGYVLSTLVEHGATKDILIDAHPHIGTDRLPMIIYMMRQTILEYGGEFYFESKITDFIIKKNEIKGVIDHKGTKFEGIAVILATGHSARDVYEIFFKNKLLVEAKPFAVGVRIEHPQALIDKIQYHNYNRGEFLPAATYQLVTQVEGRGVFSFCMCPGGVIVPSATENEQVVVNGMSNSKRNSEFANSGIVVSVELADLAQYSEHGAKAGLVFQQEIEKAAYNAGNAGRNAPAQRMTDFVENKLSSKLNKCSYNPGIVPAMMSEILPSNISQRLQKAFVIFGEKMKGYYTSDANILGVESRTSSPIKLSRDPETMQHLQIKNLYPCGEGAGYAGGIVSSALDGINCAEKIALNIKK